MTFSIFTTRMALFTTVFLYLINGNKLSADKVFVVASLYSILSSTLAGVFIRGVAELSEIKVSIERIENYLMMKENVNEKERHVESVKSLRIQEEQLDTFNGKLT
jgi:ATP-binding cassette, subfamily C (CFTR/MRP), member 4